MRVRREPGHGRHTQAAALHTTRGAVQASKRFNLSLSNAVSTSSTQIKPPNPASVTIFDDDGPGTIDLSSATYSVVEGAGVATITVNRYSASNLVETVDYATSDGT